MPVLVNPPNTVRPLTCIELYGPIKLMIIPQPFGDMILEALEPSPVMINTDVGSGKFTVIFPVILYLPC